MVRSLTSYLDTHTAIWLSNGNLNLISHAALQHMAGSALLISPVVLLEFQYLFESRKIQHRARDLQRKLEEEVGVRVCPFAFPAIAEVALDEDWTREPFDRLIVAHAKANGFAPLVSADRLIKKHYLRTIW
jgi:PIN domain nuclease of toxin-antitoxin system